MVKIISLLVLVPALLFSGEFTASVNRNHVSLGESFTLNLTLKDASAKEAPSTSALKQAFFIHSQQQASNTTIINGQMSASTTWKIVLTSLKEGEALIPSFTINTSEGALSTKPILLKVVKQAQNSGSSALDGVEIHTKVSQKNPYKNEPVIYTVTLATKRNLTNIGMQKFTVDDALVEMTKEPQIDKKLIDGVWVDTVDFSYLITPLKSGELKIPSVAVQGAIPSKRRLGGSFFDDFFQDFEPAKPIMLATEEVLLNVKPPKQDVIPWLPARSLTIEEIFDPFQTFKENEPITRSFKIKAEGIMASQLPSLNDLQTADGSFKVYMDKPESGNDFSGGSIQSFRSEQYTLIPQAAGALELPEISVAWWDVAKNEKAYARIPKRTLHIAPGTPSVQTPMPPKEEQKFTAPIPQESPERDPLLYGIIAVLAVLFLGTLIFVFALQKKIARLTEVPRKKIHPVPSEAKEKPPAKDKKEKLPDLNPT